MSVNLQYNYAQINIETGECVGCFTTSYVINHPNYVEIPTADSNYIGKYYNQSNGLWYYELEFVTEFII